MQRRKSIQTKHISDILVCVAYALAKRCEHNPDNPYWSPTTFLMNTTGASVKVVWAAMERAYDRGYVECGVSIQTGWLTDEGWELIAPFDLKMERNRG